MWTMGANNWIKYGWGTELKDEWFRGAELIVKIAATDIPSNNINALDAAALAIEHIVNNYPAPYTLMCSGGVDSQAMIWAWHVSGVPFEVVSVKYISEDTWYNEHDLITLETFTNKYKIPINYKEFDIINFLENGDLQTVSRVTDCCSPQICTHIEMSKLIKTGTVLFSGNFFDKKMTFNYTTLGIHRAAIDYLTDISIIPFFLLHTPALARSVQATIRGAYEGKGEDYRAHGFPVISQETKLTGFEKLKLHYDNYANRITVRDKILYWSRSSHRVFDILFRYRLEKIGQGSNVARTTVIVDK